MPPWLVPLESIAQKRGSDGASALRAARSASGDPRAIGGKAAGLAWLVRHSLPVPQAWVLPADAFAAALRELPPGCEPRSLLRAASGRAGYTRAAEARQEILAAELPRGLAE
jgi:phosphoenolpyruvate synthase/pyruvate phosphate dikinase